MVSLQVMLIASSSIAVVAASSDPPSSCGFGINVDLEGDYFDDFAETNLGHVQGDYVNPDPVASPQQAKYFPHAHIKKESTYDMWLSFGCEFCSDAAEKEAAMGKWAIWHVACSGCYRDAIPTDGGAKLMGTCENCPAAGGAWPWSPKATWTAYGNATQSYKGSTTCCQQACLDPNACKVDWGPVRCALADCCTFTDIGCRYAGKGMYCASAKGEGLHVMQTNQTIV